MPNKIYRVTVTLPDIVAAHAEQVVKVEASNWSTAIRLACDEISKRQHVKGKHVSNGRISFIIVDKSMDKTTSDQKTEKNPLSDPSETYQQGELFET